MPPDERRIVLLTQEQCASCDDAKDILARLSGELGLSVEVLDLDTAEGTRLAQKAGVLFAPGILVGETLISYGRPSERRLRRDLARLAGADRRS